MEPDHAELEDRINDAWQITSGDLDESAIESAIELLDRGEIRVASPKPKGDDDDASEWIVHEWVKRAVLLYFRVRPMEVIEGTFEYRDKVPVKRGFAHLRVRAVPPATARYGSYLAPGVVLMPSYVNIGARVGAGTMVDTWATVGSCAQIGSDVHLAGGVGIGGVLEPVQAAPVVVEDGAFIGSRCIVVEGAHIGREAVLGANVVVTASTPVIDMTGSAPVEHRGYVPPRAIVVPGTRRKTFPAGECDLPCAYIIGYRNPGMEGKVELNATLREHGIGT